MGTIMDIGLLVDVCIFDICRTLKWREMQESQCYIMSMSEIWVLIHLLQLTILNYSVEGSVLFK